MQLALDLAKKAKGRTSPNPMVGAVIVKSGKIIATGYHKKCGGLHAEIEALRKAGIRARGADLYLTLEPCFHYGRTPPCVDAVIASGIKRVVIAMKDPNPLTNGKSIRALKRVHIQTKVGVLQNESKKLNEVFVKHIKTKMPFVVAKCAQTLDGKIATASGQSKWITGEKARTFARNMRDEFDAILVGINTILKDDPVLRNRQKSKHLKRIVVDSSLQIPLSATIFKNNRTQDIIIVTTAKASNPKIHQLEKKSISVIICPKRDGHVDLKWAFKKLAERDITSILIEGGAHVIGSALKARLIDRLHIYLAPKIMGDAKALSAIVGLKTTDVNKAIRLEGIDVQRIGEDIFISGDVRY